MRYLKMLFLASGILLCIGCTTQNQTELPATEHTQTVAEGDLEAPTVSCKVEARISKGDEFRLEDYCIYSDNQTWYPKVTTYGQIDPTSVGEQTLTITVSDEAGNMTIQQLHVTVIDNPTPSPSPEPTPDPTEIPSETDSKEEEDSSTSWQEETNPTSGYGSGDYYVPSSGSHGSQTYLFQDGYDMDSAYSACMIDLGHYGSGSCIPIMNEEGIYTGYQLEY